MALIVIIGIYGVTIQSCSGAWVWLIIGASLSEPNIDHDNGPHARNNAIYLCIIYPAFVAPWFPRSVYVLKCSVYSSILTCSRAWFTTALSKDDWSYSCLLWRLSTKTWIDFYTTKILPEMTTSSRGLPTKHGATEYRPLQRQLG